MIGFPEIEMDDTIHAVREWCDVPPVGRIYVYSMIFPLFFCISSKRHSYFSSETRSTIKYSTCCFNRSFRLHAILYFLGVVLGQMECKTSSHHWCKLKTTNFLHVVRAGLTHERHYQINHRQQAVWS